MKRKNLSLMSIGLALIITNVFAGNKTVLVTKSNHKKANHFTKNDPPKKINKYAGKYAMADLTKNIEYDFAKTSVRTAYYDKLDKLASTVVQNKSAVSLRGYADSIGSYKGNWVISDKRANAVKDYLVTKGVDAGKIVATPFGSTKPIASNKTKAGRQKNRRVEINVTDVSN